MTEITNYITNDFKAIDSQETIVAAQDFLIDLSFWLVSAPLPAHVGVAGAALHATWQVVRFKDDDSTRCLMLFRANRLFGLIILAGILIGSFIQ